jgi:hypothetical protein
LPKLTVEVENMNILVCIKRIQHIVGRQRVGGFSPLKKIPNADSLPMNFSKHLKKN